ncbi:MAG TPA: tetratricopeptide repeat protein [Anaerolineales bacterium]|nr:tetratricopeptide repeat protein [Anaerolineales bacterium]
MSKRLEVRLLGKFDLRRDGKPITIASRPAQSLFAYLILNAGTSHRREKLAGLLWPDSLEETARDNLRHALWRMRKALESASSTRFLHADEVTISFKKSPDYWLDAAELEKLSESASADELIVVLSEYQGELLPGFYDEWVVLGREHLSSIFEHHMARLMSLLQEDKRWLDILDWGERWIKLGQRPEPAYRALMSAHAAKGDMSKVVATYQRCVKSLKEFGIEPSEPTRMLYQKLKSGEEKLKPEMSVLVKEKRKDLPKTNLPVSISSFVGRTEEIETMIQLLGKHRLLTLTGSGGVGKTRLALETSQRLLETFKDGVWWIELAGLNDPSLVPLAIAKILRVNEIQNQPTMETLIENFQPKQLLLVLDNCEHLISACTQLADQLLTGCENLKILATSREALDILGEVAWRVPSLSLPDSPNDFSINDLVESESIRLFTERARVRQPQFDLSYQNALAVVQICRRLDGIPLAIELAAARVKMMSVEEIARRLDSRFDLLTAGNRSAPPRHQTLRAAIDWSYELLTKPEQTLFRRLSIFLGGFDLSAAETVCGFEELNDHVLTLLGRLVDKSLVFVDASSKAGQTRYGLLETIREYALEKLIESGEEHIVRDHHMEFFTQLAVNAELNLLGAETLLWVHRLDAEHDNLLAAIDWSLKSDNSDFALQIVGALVQWDAWHNREGAEYSLQVVKSPLSSHLSPSRAKALNTAGVMQMFQGNLAQAHLLLEEARTLSKKLGESENYLWVLANLGGICAYEGDYKTAQAYLQEALAEAEMVPRYSMGWASAYLGDLYIFQGNREQAQQMYEDSVARLRELNNKNFLALPLRRLAELALDNAEYEKAAALYKESLKLNTEGGDQRAILACLAGFAAIATGRGNAIAAVRLFGAVDFLLHTFSASLLPIDKKAYERNIAILRSQLDETTFEIMWAEGSEMTLEQAIEFALKETKP